MVYLIATLLVLALVLWRIRVVKMNRRDDEWSENFANTLQADDVITSVGSYSDTPWDTASRSDILADFEAAKRAGRYDPTQFRQEHEGHWTPPVEPDLWDRRNG